MKAKSHTNEFLESIRLGLAAAQDPDSDLFAIEGIMKNLGQAIAEISEGAVELSLLEVPTADDTRLSSSPFTLRRDCRFLLSLRAHNGTRFDLAELAVGNRVYPLKAKSSGADLICDNLPELIVFLQEALERPNVGSFLLDAMRSAPA